MYGRTVKIGGLKASSFGVPSYMRPEDDAEFVLGSGTDLAKGCVLREVPLQDQWQIANHRYKTDVPLVVSDFRGKESSYRTWSVEATKDMPGRGVVLTPLHEGGTFFRGTKAFIVDPLYLSNSLKAIISHMEAEDFFNRVSVASSTGKGWGDVSRWTSLFHNFGFVEATRTGSTRPGGR